MRFEEQAEQSHRLNLDLDDRIDSQLKKASTLMTQDQISALQKLLSRTFFANCSKEYLESSAGNRDMEDHVSSRMNLALNNVLPWIERVSCVSEKNVVEFGCGTGSISAAFAIKGANVFGYEIESSSIEAATERARILQLKNCQFSQFDPEILPQSVLDVWENAADIVVLFAVLEHTTTEESVKLIDSAWRCLKPGGLMVVNDTPNRLSYFDYHTSHIPFFNNMTDDMLASQAWRSPREDFRESFFGRPMTEAQGINLVRWGRGVSYHAFESAIGADVHDHVILAGYESEMLKTWPMFLEDSILLAYFMGKPIAAHQAFARSALNFVLRKPEDSGAQTVLSSALV